MQQSTSATLTSPRGRGSTVDAQEAGAHEDSRPDEVSTAGLNIADTHHRLSAD